MKLVCDEGVDRPIVDALRAAGHEVVYVAELSPSITDDEVLYVLAHDRTAVIIDARDQATFSAGSLPGARSLPGSLVLSGKDVGEVKSAKDDGRLPMEDHNTRIIVFGDDEAQARVVAEALAREAFHNVTYFAGGYRALSELITAR